MPRTAWISKIALPTAVLALALTGCRDDAADSTAPDSSGSASSDAGGKGDTGTATPSTGSGGSDGSGGSAGDWNPGDDPKNHVPKGAVASSQEALSVTFWKGGTNVTFTLKPHKLETGNDGKPVRSQTLYYLQADFTYEKGDTDLMKEAAHALALYADENTPVVIPDLGDDPKVAGCFLKTEDDFGQKWSKGTARTGCEPFLVPTGKKPHYMGIFGTPPGPGSKITAVWSVS